MMFGNLLKLASSIIPQQSVDWFAFQGRTLDERGKWIDSYAPGVTITGSWQAVDVQQIKDMGFDSAKRYRRLYTPHDLKDVNRGVSPDRVMFEGALYDVVGDADWYSQDGWKSLLCVEVKA